MSNLSPEKEIKIREFYKWLGPRFKEIHNTSEGAPVDICALDPEDKEYWIRLVNNLDKSVLSIENTGTKIDNVTFYQLYAMVSNEQNVFHMELFNDGFALWFVNDLTPEQMKVTDEFTMIGITSVLHLEKPAVKVAGNDDKTYYVTKGPEPKMIPGSIDLPKTKVTRKKKS
jgi:hypothetical protein